MGNIDRRPVCARSLSLSFARPGERRLIMYELLTFARLDVAPASPSPSPTAPVIRREGIKRESRESPCRSLAFSPWGFQYLFKYRGVAPSPPPPPPPPPILPLSYRDVFLTRSNRSASGARFPPRRRRISAGIFVFSTRTQPRLTEFIRWLPLSLSFRILCCRRGGGGGGVGRFKERWSRGRFMHDIWICISRWRGRGKRWGGGGGEVNEQRFRISDIIGFCCCVELVSSFFFSKNWNVLE